MTDASGNNDGITEAPRFKPGGPGRPHGSRGKAVLAAEALLDGEANALTRKAIELAKGGDITALRLCLDRIVPPRKGRPVAFNMPNVGTSAGVAEALNEVIAAMAGGELTSDEASSIAAVLETKRKAIETVELEARLQALEDRVAGS